MQLIKSLRLRPSDISDFKLDFNQDVKLEVYVGQTETTVFQENNIWEEFELKFIKTNQVVEAGKLPEPPVIKNYANVNNQFGNTRQEALDFIIPDFITKNAFSELLKKNSSNDAEQKSQTYYQIIQDPWQDKPPLERNYGTDPYFLNNNAKVHVTWHLPFTNGTVSFYSDNYGAGLTGGINYSNEVGDEMFNKYISILQTPNGPVIGDIEPGFSQTEADIKFAKDEKKKFVKKLHCIADGTQSGKQLFVLSSNDIKNWEDANEPDSFPGDVKDLDIINKFVDIWKKKVPNYDLKLNEPNYQLPTSAIQFIRPTGTPSSATPSSPIEPIPEIKFKLSIVYNQNVAIKAGQDMPKINIYVGDPPKDGEVIFNDEFEDLNLLDEEYRESAFRGNPEAPENLSEPPTYASSIKDKGSNQTNDTSNVQSGSNISYDSGNFVILPKGNSAYSHNESQGYNLVDSKWYGDLLTSAKAHIDHPTFDIPLTESGNKGCAAWTSMVFYRAFGVHMKNGKPVVAKPTSVGEFGSIGTGELGVYFKNAPDMWERIPFREGQPGDVINTEKPSPEVSGHVGIVMDTKNADGTWNVASNSSKGFGDPNTNEKRGAGKMNYSIKKWESGPYPVYPRNPSGTHCWRYKGPKLAPGKNSF